MAGLSTLLFLVAATSPSHWQYSQTKDPITDEVRARAFANGAGGSIGVKCDAPGPGSIYVEFIAERYLGPPAPDSEARDFEYRFDGGDGQLAQWDYADDHAIASDAELVNSVIFQIGKARKLLVRTHDFRGHQELATINVSGGLAAIKRVVATCRDPLLVK